MQNLLDLFELGLGRPEEVPEIATEALIAGLETSTLIELAGAGNEDLRSFDIERLLKTVAGEIGLVDGPQPDALVRLASRVAVEILSGERTEIEGARRIWNLSRATGAHPPEVLHPFIYAASEWDEQPDRQDEFRGWIRLAAHPDCFRRPSEP